MLKSLVYITVVLVCNLAMMAQSSPKEGSLLVEVVDAVEKAPLPDAFVLIHKSGLKSDQVLKLKASGQSELDLPPGLYDVFVAADAFTPTCKVISVVAGSKTQFTAQLRADNEHLEEDSR